MNIQVRHLNASNLTELLNCLMEIVETDSELAATAKELYEFFAQSMEKDDDPFAVFDGEDYHPCRFMFCDGVAGTVDKFPNMGLFAQAIAYFTADVHDDDWHVLTPGSDGHCAECGWVYDQNFVDQETGLNVFNALRHLLDVLQSNPQPDGLYSIVFVLD